LHEVEDSFAESEKSDTSPKASKFTDKVEIEEDDGPAVGKADKLNVL